jgi:hypothetical protein
MTDFRADGTIMGPAGLTAVFGMGTGVAPPVWSPESRPAGGQAGPGDTIAVSRSRRPRGSGPGPGASLCRRGGPLFVAGKPPRRLARPPTPRTEARGPSTAFRSDAGNSSCEPPPEPAGPVGGGGGSGWSSGRLLGLVRCGGRPPYTPSPSTWSSSRSLRTFVPETSS